MSLRSRNAAEIRVVDFSAFLDGSGRQSVAEQILDSLKTTGFVYLTNYGMPRERPEVMFDWSRRFFALPTEVKMLAPHPQSGTHHRGYSPPGLEKVTQHLYDESDLRVSRAKAADVKESFECGRETDPLMPNIWLPDGTLSGFKEACLDFFWSCHEVEKSILRALAVGFRLPEDYFLQYHRVPDNQLRLLHYPSVPLRCLEANEVTRIDSHSDFGTITLLFQDEAGGLEVEDPNNPGTFIPVPPIEDSMIVNAGDFLMRWTNDTIKSTIHRVRAPQKVNEEGLVPDRYSIPYFCSADFSAVVDSIPGTWSTDNPKRYEPISAQEYIMKRLAASYWTTLLSCSRKAFTH